MNAGGDTRHQGSSGLPANASGDTVLSKKDSLLGHLVKVGSMNMWIEQTKSFHGPVIGIEKNNVHWLFGCAIGSGFLTTRSIIDRRSSRYSCFVCLIIARIVVVPAVPVLCLYASKRDRCECLHRAMERK
jgi:hypothetical protein